MDAQMKRGFLEMCVLASLQGRDSYGYQIVKDVPDILGLTESTLYPLLKRLEKAECLTAYSVEHNGRLRKITGSCPQVRSASPSSIRAGGHHVDL